MREINHKDVYLNLYTTGSRVADKSSELLIPNLFYILGLWFGMKLSFLMLSTIFAKWRDENKYHVLNDENKIQ